jgi:hypothetical protein
MCRHPGAPNTVTTVSSPTAERPERRVEINNETGTMHIAFHEEIAAQRAAELHQQAAKQRLLRELRASRKPTGRRPRIWERLTVRRPRPAVMTRTPPARPVGAHGGQTAARRAG